MANLEAIAVDGLTIVYLWAEGEGTEENPYKSKFLAAQQGDWSVEVNNFPGVQVVAGASGALATETTLAALNTKLTSTNSRLLIDGSGVTQPVSVTTLPLPSGAATSSNQSTIITHVDGIETLLTTIDADTSAVASAVSNSRLQVDVATAPVINISDNGGSLTVDGTVELGATSLSALENISVAVSNSAVEIANDQGNPIPITGVVTANIGTAGVLATETTVGSINTKLPSGLTVSATRLLTDGSGVTQPVSATSLPLPTGAATSSNQDTTNATLSNIDTKVTGLATESTLSTLESKIPTLTVTSTRLLVDGSGVTQPITGTVKANTVGTTDNNWTTLKTWSVDTIPATNNVRPTNWVTVPELDQNTQQLEVLVKLKTTPSASYRLFLWVDDGVEKYCVSPGGGNAGENSISISDSNGVYDGVAPILVDLKRYTESIRLAAVVLLDQPAIVFDNLGNCVNQGFVGTEAIALSTTGTLPLGLSGRITTINPSTNVVTWTGATFADGELTRINLTNVGTNVIPYLGLSASGLCNAININTDTLVLDGRSELDFAVGDVVRFRAAPGSTLFSVAGTVISVTTNYIICSKSGQNYQISLDGVTPLTITAPGQGVYYVFKFPYTPVYVKGSNQLSYTQGGTAIDFKVFHDARSVTVTAGTAALITLANSYVEGEEVSLTATAAPGGSFIGQKFFIRNPTGSNFNLSQTITGPLVAFTSAGTAVQFINSSNSASATATVTAGTPASIALPLHYLSTLRPFTLSGSPVPSGYSNQSLYVIANGLTSNSVQFSDRVSGCPCTFGSTGTSVTLTAAISGVGYLPIEKTTAFIAPSPSPTDYSVAFANTTNGAAITLAGGIGNHAFSSASTPQIKSGSYVKVRAI